MSIDIVSAVSRPATVAEPAQFANTTPFAQTIRVVSPVSARVRVAGPFENFDLVDSDYPIFARSPEFLHLDPNHALFVGSITENTDIHFAVVNAHGALPQAGAAAASEDAGGGAVAWPDVTGKPDEFGNSGFAAPARIADTLDTFGIPISSAIGPGGSGEARVGPGTFVIAPLESSLTPPAIERRYAWRYVAGPKNEESSYQRLALVDGSIEVVLDRAVVVPGVAGSETGGSVLGASEAAALATTLDASPYSFSAGTRVILYDATGSDDNFSWSEVGAWEVTDPSTETLADLIAGVNAIDGAAQFELFDATGDVAYGGWIGRLFQPYFSNQRHYLGNNSPISSYPLYGGNPVGTLTRAYLAGSAAIHDDRTPLFEGIPGGTFAGLPPSLDRTLQRVFDGATVRAQEFGQGNVANTLSASGARSLTTLLVGDLGIADGAVVSRYDRDGSSAALNVGPTTTLNDLMVLLNYGVYNAKCPVVIRVAYGRMTIAWSGLNPNIDPADVGIAGEADFWTKLLA